MHPIHANLIEQAARIEAELRSLSSEAHRNLLADSAVGHQLRLAAEHVKGARASLPLEIAALEGDAT